MTDRPRVLVVDDNALVARVCARALRPQCDVEVAHTVDAALVIIRAVGALDGVWSDRSLPEPNRGVEVLRAAAASHPGAVLLLVTGDLSRPGLEALPPGVRLFHKDSGVEAVRFMLDALAARWPTGAG